LGSILEKIEQALKDMLIGWIESNLTNMFTDVNEKVGTIAAEVGQTPSGWNGGVYQMIRGLSENVIVPHRWYHHHLRFVLRADFHDHREKQPSRHGHLDVLQVVFQGGCGDLSRNTHV
jgi:hypothetical protein